MYIYSHTMISCNLLCTFEDVLPQHYIYIIWSTTLVDGKYVHMLVSIVVQYMIFGYCNMTLPRVRRPPLCIVGQ